MQWYEIMIGIVVFIAGTYIGIKVKEYHRDRYYNNSWRDRKK